MNKRFLRYKPFCIISRVFFFAFPGHDVNSFPHSLRQSVSKLKLAVSQQICSFRHWYFVYRQTIFFDITSPKKTWKYHKSHIITITLIPLKCHTSCGCITSSKFSQNPQFHFSQQYPSCAAISAVEFMVLYSYRIEFMVLYSNRIVKPHDSYPEPLIIIHVCTAKSKYSRCRGKNKLHTCHISFVVFDLNDEYCVCLIPTFYERKPQC